MDPSFEKLTYDESASASSRGHGSKDRQRILDEFRRGHPDASAAELFAIRFSAGTRHAAVQQAALKAAQGGARAYVYWFTWDSPILDGRLHSFHCARCRSFFDNTDAAIT